MATLYVRNVPDTIITHVRQLAAEKQISVNAEVIAIMEESMERQALKRERLEAMQHIEQLRSRFRPSIDGRDSLSLLREDRAR